MPVDDVDRYRGRIALKDRSCWRWSFLQPEYETVARKDQPNRHLRVQRINGEPIAFKRGILLKGPLLTEDEKRTIDTVKYGLVIADSVGRALTGTDS